MKKLVRNYNFVKYFNVHNITVKLETNDRKFFDFVLLNYYPFTTKGKDNIEIEVKFDGIHRFFEKKPRIDKNFSKIGKGLYRKDRELLYHFPEKVVYFSYDDNIKIRARYFDRFDQTIRRFPFIKKEFIYKKYQLIMREILHFPIFYLLSKRGIFPLHGSCIDINGEGIIFFGLNGSGKSTITRFFLNTENIKMLSENFVLFSENTLFAFPEVIRMDSKSLEICKIKKEGLIKIYGKYHLYPDEERFVISTKPKALFLTSFGALTKVYKIDKQKIFNTITSFHSFLKEFHTNSFIILFEIFNEGINLEQYYLKTLQIFLENIDTYGVEVNPRENIEKAEREILNVLFNS